MKEEKTKKKADKIIIKDFLEFKKDSIFFGKEYKKGDKIKLEDSKKKKLSIRSREYLKENFIFS